MRSRAPPTPRHIRRGAGRPLHPCDPRIFGSSATLGLMRAMNGNLGRGQARARASYTNRKTSP
jgi:hypothetical protein